MRDADAVTGTRRSHRPARRRTVRRRGARYEVEDGCLVDKSRRGRYRIYLFVWVSPAPGLTPRRSIEIIDGRDKRGAERKMVAFVRAHKACVLNDRQVARRREAVGWLA